MTKNELKVEESFLGSAVEAGAALRLSLSSRERISGTLSHIGRSDITLMSEGVQYTIPKKEVQYLSAAQPLLPEDFFRAETGPDLDNMRSRVQDEFLDRFVKEKTLALLCMMNGDELRGVIEGFDSFTLSIRTSRGQVLIYKHGLSSIGPGYRRRTG
ncbi:MAG: RNA chaperone Hfq [Nitrospirae bacterium]|nr:RNA chaperone Hfq [Nitrospirota bacterium]